MAHQGLPEARKKLSQQVKECQVSWFHEAIEYAADGDPVQMGLVGIMLKTGWGCKPDEKEAEKWLAEASRHGAEMPPGYKEPPITEVPPPAALANLARPGAVATCQPQHNQEPSSSEGEDERKQHAKGGRQAQPRQP